MERKLHIVCERLQYHSDLSEMMVHTTLTTPVWRQQTVSETCHGSIHSTIGRQIVYRNFFEFQGVRFLTGLKDDVSHFLYFLNTKFYDPVRRDDGKHIVNTFGGIWTRLVLDVLNVRFGLPSLVRDIVWTSGLLLQKKGFSRRRGNTVKDISSDRNTVKDISSDRARWYPVAPRDMGKLGFEEILLGWNWNT